MALVSMRELLDHAAENGYGIPAFNVNNLEQVQAVMSAADEVGAPVILQASAGARKYAGEHFIKYLIQAASEAYPHIPMVMHQDHGTSPAICRGALELGFKKGGWRDGAAGGAAGTWRRCAAGVGWLAGEWLRHQCHRHRPPTASLAPISPHPHPLPTALDNQQNVHRSAGNYEEDAETLAGCERAAGSVVRGCG